jgi:hypothetical protein
MCFDAAVTSKAPGLPLRQPLRPRLPYRSGICYLYGMLTVLSNIASVAAATLALAVAAIFLLQVRAADAAKKVPVVLPRRRRR